MGVMTEVTEQPLPALLEAKKGPNPEKFIPVFDWSSSHVWVWLRSPGGKIVGPSKLLNSHVQKFSAKLGWPNQVITYAGMIDPTSYSGPADIYPATWKAGDSLEPDQLLGASVKAKFKPPVLSASGKKVAALKVPSGVVWTAEKDPNGYPMGEDENSGEEFSVLPNGKFGQWDASEGVYYAVVEEDGMMVVWNAPKYKLGDVQAAPPKLPQVPGKDEPDAKPPEHFELPPNYAVQKVTPTHVVATAPDGTKVKWISVTDHWVHADEPHKEHEPLQAAGVAPEPPNKPKAKKSKAKAAPEPEEPSSPKGAPSVPEPGTKMVLSDEPEPAPHLTVYTGMTDPNGLPLVDEVPEGDYEDEDVVKGLTLLPDDRVARWKPNAGHYLVYEYNPHYGFMYSKHGDTVTVDEADQLLQALSLAVKKGRYHKVSHAGAGKPQVSTHAYPLPEGCKLISKKDLHGFPMVVSTPDDEDEEVHELTLLPNSRLSRWDAKANKYLYWEWRDIFGDYNYYPTHPPEWINLKQVQKMAVQAGGGLPPKPKKAPAPPLPITWAKSSPPKKPAISAALAGMLKPTGKSDPKGYSTGSYHKDTYSMLPDNKVGKWSGPNGAYILYKYDASSDSFYNTAHIWTPPGHHRALSTALIGGKDFAQVMDSAGTEAIVLPNGKFVQYSKGKYAVLKVNPTKGKVFEKTGEVLTNQDILGLETGAHLSLKPTGEVDVHGLSTYKVTEGSQIGAVFTLLPNGDFARWNFAKQAYRRYDHEASDNPEVPSVWYQSVPAEWFTLNDVNAMYLKSGTEKAHPEDTHLKPADTLKLTGSVDPNSYPYVEVTSGVSKGLVLSMLPNGVYAKWRKVVSLYHVYAYRPDMGAWAAASPQKMFSLSDLESSGAVPEEPEPEPTPAPKAPPTAVFVTPQGDLPDPNTLEDIGAASLKGVGKKTRLRDPETGKLYLFKPALPKTGPKKTQAFKAKSQEAFAAIAAVGRPDAHVPVETVKYKGQLGTLQPMLDLDEAQPDLAGVPPADLTEQQKVDVASEHLLDWLMSQHDSFAANLVLTKDGRIVGIDKEQGWKYVDHATQSDRLATDYKPNSVLYGEQEPYYNKFWKAFADGSMSFDPEAMKATLENLEAMDPRKMEAALEDYAASRDDMRGPTKAYDRYAFVKKMLSRKNTLRYDFEQFITEQYEKRTGKKGKFTFNTGWVPEGETVGPKFQTISQSAREWILSEFGPKALKPHNEFPELVLVRVDRLEPVTKVQEFLSTMGVEPATHDPDGGLIPNNPIFGSNYNSVIVRADDLNKVVTKEQEIKQDPGQKYADHLGSPTYLSQVLAPEASPGDIEGLSKVHTMQLGPLGRDFTLDADAVEQQTASVQRVVEDGETYYRVHFKLREPYWRSLQNLGKSSTFTWSLGAYDGGQDALVVSEGYQTGALSKPARHWKFGKDELYVMTDSASYTFMGSVYAIVRSGGDKVRSVLDKMLKAVGVAGQVMKNPTKEDMRLYNLSQALWYLSPKSHQTLVAGGDMTAEAITKKLKGHLAKDEIDSIRQVRGTVGRGAAMVPGLWRKLGGGTPEKPAVRFVFWNVNKTSLPKILKSAATGIHERVRMGLPGGGSGTGASETTDIETGGADTTTMRISTAQAKNTAISTVGNVRRPVRLIIAPELLDRLDVSIASGDAFGCQNPVHHSKGHYFKNRKGMSAAIKSFDGGGSATHRGNTEIQIRRGVPPHLIKRACVSSESVRKVVLEECEKAGITEHNKVPIEDFVVVEDNAGSIYNKYLKPLGY